MSGSLSTWLETQLLNHAFSTPAYTPPATLFAALFTVAPTADGGGVEVSGGGYTRMAVTFSAASGSPPKTSNPNAVQWPAASADWGTVISGGLFDAAVAGNYLGSATLVSAVDGITPAALFIPAGAVFRLPALGLVIGFQLPVSQPVPFSEPPGSRIIMRPMIGEVIDGAGVPRQGVVMTPTGGAA